MIGVGAPICIRAALRLAIRHPDNAALRRNLSSGRATGWQWRNANILVDHAAGGTNSPGATPGAFVVSAGKRMRYDVPASALAACVTGYAIYIDEGRAPLANWFLPAQPMIVLLLDAGPVTVHLRKQTIADLDRATLWGPTSQAFRIETRGGISVGIGLSAEGWIRLTGRSAKDALDQVTPLVQTMQPGAVQALLGTLDALDDDAAIAPALDRLFSDGFGPAPRGADSARRLAKLILTEDVINVARVAERLGLDIWTLGRLSTRYFGMPVKSLLLRARFIRSFTRWLADGEPVSYHGIDESYHGASHFLRDAARYLGSTPRRFAKQETTFLRASIRARHAVLGAAAHVLHRF